MKKNRACSTKGRENIRDRLFFRDALLLHANACDGVAVENLDMRAMALRSMLALSF